MKKYPGWERRIANLRSTNNKMVCVSRDQGLHWKYFSRNAYNGINKAIEASDKWILTTENALKNKKAKNIQA